MKTIRTAVVFVALSAASIALSQARSVEPIRFDIEEQTLGSALQAFSAQAHVQVLRRDEDVSLSGLRAPTVVGSLPADQALSQLLAGSGFTFEFINEKTVKISALARDPAQKSEVQPAPQTRRQYRLAEASATQSTDSQREPIQEVLVTANRREQRAQDVPATLQVVSGNDLDQRGANGFEDYMLTVPGASYRNQGNGGQRIAMRGVSNAVGSDFGTTTTVSTVGLYLDDIPIQGTSVLPDLSLYDLDRVEVLKGPQGTLYGEGAMGGAIKMVLNTPDFTEFKAKTDITLSDTESGGFNDRIRAGVNIPLVADRAGLRLAGTYRKNEGFVNNVSPVRPANKQNDDDGFSVHGVLAVQITDDFTARLTALHDESSQDDFPEIDRRLPDLEINSAEDRYNRTSTSIFGLSLKYDLGIADLTSVTSYYSSHRNFQPRFPLVSFFTTGVQQEAVHSVIDLDSKAEEIRLVSKGESRLNYIVGAFYRDKSSDFLFDINMDPADYATANANLVASGQPPFTDPLIFHDLGFETFKQKAVYGEITYEIVKDLNFTTGLRWYEERRTYEEPAPGVNGVLDFLAVGTPETAVKDNGVIPKFSLSYKLAADDLVYLLASKGFRSSTINLNQRLGAGDEGASSDSLWNYELGVKTAWADGRFIANATAFYEDWSNIQLNFFDFNSVLGSLGIGFVDNGGNAAIWGGELELIAAPTRNIRYGVTVGYTHSEMKKGVLNIVQGATLPNAPKITASTYAEYRVPVGAASSVFARFDVSYVDKQASRVITTDDPSGHFLDAYTIGNLRFGWDAKTWGVAGFVDNLWNERAELGTGLVLAASVNDANRVTINRPRTFGVMFNKNF